MQKVSVPPRRVHKLSAHGVTYTIDPGSLRPHREAIIDRGEPLELPLLEHIYEQGFKHLAVDVGAHVGNHTLWFAKVCKLRVEAFEPIHYRALIKNVKRNALMSTVGIHTVALGARAGYARQTGPINVTPGRKGEIDVARLDDLHLPRTSFMKIDVEGLEAPVLRGATRTIERDHPVIFAEEWEDPQWHQRIAKVLTPLGYEMTKKWSPPTMRAPMGRWDYVG